MNKTIFRFSKEKHPTYPVFHEHSIPETGQKITGWWIRDKPSTVLTRPDPEKLNGCGWIQVFTSLFFCWPCAWVPCICSFNYDGYQIPCYE